MSCSASVALTMRMPWWALRLSRSASPETMASAWAAIAQAMGLDLTFDAIKAAAAALINAALS